MGYAPPPHCILSHHNHSHISRSMDPRVRLLGTGEPYPSRCTTRAAGGHDSSGLTFDCIYEGFFFDCFPHHGVRQELRNIGERYPAGITSRIPPRKRQSQSTGMAFFPSYVPVANSPPTKTFFFRSLSGIALGFSSSSCILQKVRAVPFSRARSGLRPGGPLLLSAVCFCACAPVLPGITCCAFFQTLMRARSRSSFAQNHLKSKIWLLRGGKKYLDDAESTSLLGIGVTHHRRTNHTKTVALYHSKKTWQQYLENLASLMSDVTECDILAG